MTQASTMRASMMRASMRTIAARVHAPAWFVCAALGASCWVTGATIDAFAADPSVPVIIEGAGDADVVNELVPWQNTMFAADQPSDLQYFQRGTNEARAQLLSGSADYVLSGVGFTDAELAARPAGAGRIIDVPISLTAYAVLVTDPRQVSWKTFIAPPAECDDPDFVPPNDAYCNVQEGLYTGPLRLPPDNLSAVLLDISPQYLSNNLQYWGSPATKALMDLGSAQLQVANQRPFFLNRTEGAAWSVSMQQYAQAMAPTVWGYAKSSKDPGWSWEPIREVLTPRLQSRYGFDTAIGLAGRPNIYTGGDAPAAFANNGIAVPMTYVERAKRDYPAAKFQYVQVQNRHGDWVLPTRDSIEKAFAAGSSMNIGATADVPGAYPFTWVTRLYTVAGTLDPDQANAMAASIRYIATDGQDEIVADGGAPLTAGLRSEALAAADEIVRANCTAAGYEVTTGGPGAFEPKTAQVQAIATMAHCTKIPPPPTTTTTTVVTTTTVLATTTTTIVSSSPPTTPTTVRVASGSGSRPPTVVVPTADQTPVSPSDAETTTVPSETTTTAVVDSGSTTTTQPTVGATTTRKRGRALSQLPLSLPSDGAQGFKKLGTLLLGAGMFLFGRRLVSARRSPA